VTGTVPAWLTAEVRALYGVERDHVIAERVGVTLGTVRWWRRVLGLPARGVGRPKNDPRHRPPTAEQIALAERLHRAGADARALAERATR